jgi:hypothetical protein
VHDIAVRDQAFKISAGGKRKLAGASAGHFDPQRKLAGASAGQ